MNSIEQIKKKKNRPSFNKNAERKRRVINMLIKNCDGVPICAYCGCTIPEDKLTVDHVIPVSKGGTDKFANLALACFSCNHRKRDLLEEPVYRKTIELPKGNFRGFKLPRREVRKIRFKVKFTINDIWPGVKMTHKTTERSTIV